MHRAAALATVSVLWAAIYLPGLGSTEIKGEEGRRILPAITMLETGNWLVPYVGGEPFLRKPPLVNWAIAGMFKLTGVRNEWTARLPSALCVLALALTIVGTSGPGWMTVETSLLAAVMAMTQFGLLAKAKFAGAEIEGIYAPLSGMAMVCWLGWRAQRRSPWLVWCVPGVLLGLACLAKGPSLHLVFFYAIVLAVLWGAGELRALLHPAHLASMAIVAAIFAAWAVPYFRAPEASGAMQVWKHQGVDRFASAGFKAADYFTNIPRALGDQLPWLLLVPLLAKSNASPHLARAVALCFFGVMLIPGALPRYVLPLGAPIALLLAPRFVHPVRLAIGTGVVFGFAMIFYALVIVPRMNARDDLRPLARAIDAAIPPSEPLVLYDPGYLAAIFYLRTPYRYALGASEIPPGAPWVLARGKGRARLEKRRPDLRVARTFSTSVGQEIFLFHRDTEAKKVPAP